jgi:hypothetical protein
VTSRFFAPMKTTPAYVICLAAWLAQGVLLPAQPAATVVTRTHAERIGASVLSAKTERISPTVTRLSVTPKLEAAANFKLLDSAWREVAATATRDGALQAEVVPGRAYVLVPRTTLRRALQKDGLEFPARYINVTPQGATTLGGLFIRPARVPLTWNEEARTYTTELFVGYEFVDGAERTLSAPKTVTFFAEGANARVQADTVRVTKSGVSGYQRVTLFTGEVDGATHFTARAGPADELKTSVTVEREPAVLKPSMRHELAAFGFGSATLTVALLARDGRPLAPATPLELRLRSRGRVRHQETVSWPAGKPSVEVGVRSTGYGVDEIVVEARGLEAKQPVRMFFPLAALVAALVGGGLGGTARHLRRFRKTPAVLKRRTLEGVVVGIILVGAAWTGLVAIDMSTGVLGTPFGAFVLAALGGYVGCVLLDRIAGKTFGGLKPK